MVFFFLALTPKRLPTPAVNYKKKHVFIEFHEYSKYKI